jgi:hypothetical protein
VATHLLDDRRVSHDRQDQPPPPREREGVLSVPVTRERVQSQAGDLEELAELADVTDGGDAAKEGPPDVVAPLPVGTAFLLRAPLKVASAKLNVQLRIQPLAEVSACTYVDVKRSDEDHIVLIV